MSTPVHPVATPLHTNTSTRLVDSERRVGAAAGSMKRLSVRLSVPPSWASTPLEHWGAGRRSSAEDARIEAP